MVPSRKPLNNWLSMKEESMRLLEAALAGPNCVMSVMGDHAGEGADEIFNRKKSDINRLGKTFWLIRSSKARPAQVRGMCTTIPAYAILRLNQPPRAALAPLHKKMQPKNTLMMDSYGISCLKA